MSACVSRETEKESSHPTHAVDMNQIGTVIDALWDLMEKHLERPDDANLTTLIEAEEIIAYLRDRAGRSLRDLRINPHTLHGIEDVAKYLQDPRLFEAGVDRLNGIGRAVGRLNGMLQKIFDPSTSAALVEHINKLMSMIDVKPVGGIVPAQLPPSEAAKQDEAKARRDPMSAEWGGNKKPQLIIPRGEAERNREARRLINPHPKQAAQTPTDPGGLVQRAAHDELMLRSLILARQENLSMRQIARAASPFFAQ